MTTESPWYQASLAAIHGICALLMTAVGLRDGGSFYVWFGLFWAFMAGTRAGWALYIMRERAAKESP